jgi:hypothetical protein
MKESSAKAFFLDIVTAVTKLDLYKVYTAVEWKTHVFSGLYVHHVFCGGKRKAQLPLNI